MSADPVVFEPATPRTVRWAVICLGVVTVWAASLLAAEWMRLVTPRRGSNDLVSVVTVGFLVVTTAKIADGRGWARWLFAIMYVLGAPWAAIVFLLKPELFAGLPALSIVSMILTTILQTAAVVLLFTRSSRQWFKQPRAQAVPPATQ